MFKTICNIKGFKVEFKVGPLDWQVNSCVPSIKIASTQFFIKPISGQSDTYDHRSVRTGHPVRSAIHKH